MPHENRKMYMPPKCTGTIPKVKQRNNNNASSGTDRRSNVVSNNLGNETDAIESNREHLRNQNRNIQFYQTMDTNQETPRQNGITSNGVASTPIESHSQPVSRRNSSGLSKCDNVSKYPDKKQIENKLSQIQEYLQVATSMRSNMKKTDEQMQSLTIQSPNLENFDESLDEEQLDAIIKDLVDSEYKLQVILNDLESSPQFSDAGSDQVDHERNKNELEQKVDVATRDLQMLKEHENFLLHMQLNAENQLREAKYAQAKLARAAATRNTNHDTDWCNESDTLSNSGTSSSRNMDIRELEDRIKSFKVDEMKLQPDQFQGQIDLMQNHIQQMRDNNDNRAQLIQILDTRDAQLQAQHNTLQGKLQELQNKKNQVDQLVVQLQKMNEETEEDDITGNVRKICTMKEQLTKLKDMLNIVSSTENSIIGQDQTESINSEMEENVNRLIAKTDNMMQPNRIPHVENIENPASRGQCRASSNERLVREKQVNKKSMNANERERMKLQAELRAKRQELEELMCKQKAANSNLNHDIHSEKNSEMGACSNTIFENMPNAWYPMDSNIFNTQQQSSESDDCPDEEPNEYSIMNSSNEINSVPIQPMPVLNFPTANYIRKRSQDAQSPRFETHHDAYLTSSPRSPARSVRSATPAFPPRESSSSRSQMQKQLELIKSVCDSMIDSTNSVPTEQTTPVRVRNNLTPSPIYTEPRNYAQRPNTNRENLNVVSYPEGPNNVTSPQNIPPSDSAAYNNWLTTNSLQTQAFILNTLNQCCQMLWHQQKELSSLRNTVNLMQDRIGGPVYHDEGTPMCMQSNPCIYQPNLPNLPHHSNTNFLPNNFRHQMKMNHLPPNHQGNINSGSMPNLNGHCSHSATNSATNMEHAAYCNNMLPNNCNNMLPNNAVAGNVQQHQNIIGEHPVNTNHIIHHNQNVPTPIWNGQALNNQVPPGNRANNYWDNFRSYSRQNLFSTKSNDGTQNLINDRSNQSSDRQRSFHHDLTNSTVGLSALYAKSNSNHNEALAASISTENSPRRAKVHRRFPVPQPPVTTQHIASLDTEVKTANNEGQFSLPSIDIPLSLETTSEDETVNRNATRNEWPNESSTTKTKLFEDLRENVYKEVASLISANEGYPHFLIQLFRDLQLVSSDPLRRNILQSIQSIITNSLASSNSVLSLRQQIGNEPENSSPSDNFITNNEETNSGFPMLIHPTMQETSAAISEGNINDMTDISPKDVIFSSVWPLLSNHGISEERLDVNNQDQHFHDSLFSDRANCDESQYMDNILPTSPFISNEETPRLQILIQNGDLAEADQSRVANEEDEGAVGGLLNILERSSSSNGFQFDCNELSMETEDESLDQVPTRLSNPPSVVSSPKLQ